MRGGEMWTPTQSHYNCHSMSLRALSTHEDPPLSHNSSISLHWWWWHQQYSDCLNKHRDHEISLTNLSNGLRENQMFPSSFFGEISIISGLFPRSMKSPKLVELLLWVWREKKTTSTALHTRRYITFHWVIDDNSSTWCFSNEASHWNAISKCCSWGEEELVNSSGHSHLLSGEGNSHNPFYPQRG